MPITLNAAPPIDDFCAKLPTIDFLPAINMPLGNQIIESIVDVTKGTPGICQLSLSTIGFLESALAPMQPLFDILDLVTTIAQCTILMSEVITNPFKIPDLLGCIPGLITKVNKVLALVPIFPQGIGQIVTFVVDVIRFVGTVLACVIAQLEAVEATLLSLQADLANLNRTDDPTAVDRLEELLDCGMKTAEDTVTSAVGSLGPVARILCTARAFLALTGDEGREIAKRLTIPDPSNITALSFAIDFLKVIDTTLLTFVEIVTTIGAPFGAPFPPPEIGFVCPLDDSDFGDTEELPVPVITHYTDEAGNLNPVFISGSASVRIIVFGSGFIDVDQTKLYWNTAPISIESMNENQMTVLVSNQLLINPGMFLLLVTNEPKKSSSPFSGLTDPVSGLVSPSAVVTSVPFEVEVT